MISAEQHIFLKALSEQGNVTAAAQAAELPRRSVYRMRAQNPEFAQAWDNALDEATDHLAHEAMRRALTGVEEVRYFKGEPIGTVRKYSDQLLMFLLRAYRPTVFAQKKKEPTPHDNAVLDNARQELIKKMAKINKEDDAK